MLGPYIRICGIRTVHTHILFHADLPCASDHVYSCQRLAEASISTSLLVHTEHDSQANQALMCRIEFISVVFAVYLLLTIRGSGSNAIYDVMPISNPNFMTISGIWYDFN